MVIALFVGMVLISLILLYCLCMGGLSIDILRLSFLYFIFSGMFIFYFDNIVRSRVETLNAFLVDNSAYINNNSLKYYDKEMGNSGDEFYIKHLDYIDENKIQVSLSKFDEETCKNIVKFTNSSSKVNSQLFKKEYTIKMDTLISDENEFCKNKDNKIAYTININDKNK